MNLGNAIEVYVDGKKMEGVFSFKLCANGDRHIGRHVEIERAMKWGNGPLPTELGDEFPAERLLFSAQRVEIVDTGIKFNA